MNIKNEMKTRMTTKTFKINGYMYKTRMRQIIPSKSMMTAKRGQ